MGNPLVGKYIQYDYTLRMEHGPTTDAGFEWKTLTFPEWANCVLIGIKALPTLPEDESDTISTSQLARCSTHKRHYVRHIFRTRDFLRHDFEEIYLLIGHACLNHGLFVDHRGLKLSGGSGSWEFFSHKPIDAWRIRLRFDKVFHTAREDTSCEDEPFNQRFSSSEIQVSRYRWRGH